MANFMSIRPVTGLNTINNILRLIRLPAIPVDAPIVRHIAKLLVVREMNMLFSQLRAEDVHIDFEGVNAFNETQLSKICFRRGINIGQSDKEMQKDLKLWLSISNLSNVPHSLLLISRVSDFNSGMFKIDEDEQEEEVLRRDRESLYQLESMRAFEMAFGIDRLEKIIQEVKSKRDVSSSFESNRISKGTRKESQRESLYLLSGGSKAADGVA